MKHVYLFLIVGWMSAGLSAECMSVDPVPAFAPTGIVGLAGPYSSTDNEAMRGFLLTKDNYRLTGYVNQINYIVTGLEIEFTNDFGDHYHIYPSLVKGFGFTKDGETFRYVSRYHEGRWYFLEMIEKKKHIDFYQLPSGSERYVDDSILSLISEPIPEYWIQVKGQKLLGVSRAGFKRKMRAYFELTAPELAKKIGSKGYRYRDIERIVTEFETNYRRSKQVL